MNHPAAKALNDLGVDIEEVRRHGRWTGDRLTQSYLSPISRMSVRVLAGFPKNSGSYFLERDTLPVPPSLEAQVFPEVDEWMAKVQTAEQSPGIATNSFLKLMLYLKKVILQDSVILRDRYPASPLWSDPLFQSPDYLAFSETSRIALQALQSPFDLRLRDVLPQVSEKLHLLQQAVISSQHHVVQSIMQGMANMETRRPAPQMDMSSIVGIFARHLDQCAIEMAQRSQSNSGSLQGASPSAMSSPSGPCPDTPTTAPMPRYAMSREITTVMEWWQEWDQELYGQPCVRDLEMSYGAKWRAQDAERKFFQRRNRITIFLLEHFQDLRSQPGRESLTMTEVVQAVDEQRMCENLSLNQLSEKIRQKLFFFSLP